MGESDSTRIKSRNMRKSAWLCSWKLNHRSHVHTAIIREDKWEQEGLYRVFLT